MFLILTIAVCESIKYPITQDKLLETIENIETKIRKS
jgi:hypothetical protein